jgi:hypothetical protein
MLFSPSVFLGELLLIAAETHFLFFFRLAIRVDTGA